MKFNKSIYLSIYLSSYLSIYPIPSHPIQSHPIPSHPIPSYPILSIYLSIYLPQFLSLTTSKTKHFCETSICFKFHNIENKAILRDILQKGKVECRVDGLVPMGFAIFPVHLSKLLHLPRRSDARSCEVLHLPQKMHLCRSSSNVPRLPSFLEMLQNPHVFLTFDKVRSTIPCACHAKRHLNVQKWRGHVVLLPF